MGRAKIASSENCDATTHYFPLGLEYPKIKTGTSRVHEHGHFLIRLGRDPTIRRLCTNLTTPGIRQTPIGGLRIKACGCRAGLVLTTTDTECCKWFTAVLAKELTWQGECALHVPFICTGNICRSPTEERLAAAYGARYEFPVSKHPAGTRAVIAHPINHDAVLVLEKLGGDPSNFAAGQLTTRIASDPDLFSP